MPLTLNFIKRLAKANKKLPEDLHLEMLQEEYRFLSPKVHHLAKEILKRKRRRFFKYIFPQLSAKVVMCALVIYVISMFSPKIEVHRPVRVVTIYKNDSTMNLNNFLKQIAFMESRYDSSANRPGSQFWGLYQIGNDGRKNAGYGDVSKDTYSKHPEIQHMCMINLLKYDKKYLQKYIDKYSGKIVDGILMTESGILGLAHLGVGYAKACLDNGYIPEVDEHGNHPRLYAKLGGYVLNLDKQ